MNISENRALENHFEFQGELIDKYLLGLHRDDYRFLKKKLSSLPSKIQGYLLENYASHDSNYSANCYIRNMVDKLDEILPVSLKKNFNANEQDLRELSDQYAQECRYIVECVERNVTPNYRNLDRDLSTELERLQLHRSALSNHRKLTLTAEYENTSKGYVKFEDIYLALSDITMQKGVTPPTVNKRLTYEGAIKRLCDEIWWLKRLRKQLKQSIETACLQLNQVNKFKGIYASDITVSNRLAQKQYSERLLESTSVVNELGQSYNLKELSDLNVSNPKIRKAELMVRMRGFEDLANESNHQGVFTTITCPSKYHASLSKSGKPNPKYQDLTPYQAQQYLNNVWQRIRAELDRQDIRLYGLRVAEPQHDGTPHWHMLLFMPKSDVNAFKKVVRHYSLLEDGTEKGAKENRCDFKDIDPTKGSATGYIAKYIAKNVEGEGLDEGVYGENPIQAAQRVEAWASCWSIRQFQQIGGVSVTVWRELRRLKAQTNPDDKALENIRQAADESNWGEFTQLMGGVFCKRNEQAIRPWFDCAFDTETGEVKQSWMDKNVIYQLKGILHKGKQVITRFHQWTIERSKDAFSQKAFMPSLEFCK